MEQELIDKLTTGGVDVASTIARFGGNENLFLKYLRRFPADPTLGTLQAAMQSGDREEIKRTCHTLKGLSGNLGLTPLFNACATMMNELRASDTSDVSALYAEVCRQHTMAIELVQGV